MSKKFGKIWTISSTDDTMREPVEHFVAGAYADYDDAVSALVDYIMDRLEWNRGIAYGFAHDENHVEMRDAVSVSDDGETVFDGGENDIRAYVKETIENNGCYYIYDGEDSYHFDLDGCDIVFNGDNAVTHFVEGLETETDK